jgi:hypothetical protein
MQMRSDLLDLEAAIKQFPGILGCVIFASPHDVVTEIQIFACSGRDHEPLVQHVLSELDGRRLDRPSKGIHVFELETESLLGDRQVLAEAAEAAEREARARGPADPETELADAARRARPLVSKVLLTNTTWQSEARVALVSSNGEIVGQAAGEKTPHGLKVVAEATIRAVRRLLGGGSPAFRGASLVKVVGEDAVLVIAEVEGRELLGAALVRGGPVADATVRATLDALNRRISRSR